MTSPSGGDLGNEFGEPVFRDKRFIDREPAAVVTGPSAEVPAAADLPPAPSDDTRQTDRETLLVAEAQERLDDLLRLKAEYDNYRRRVERERIELMVQGAAKAATSLLPILDDVDRAKAHEELTGGFKAVADGLDRAVVAMGLVRIGETGETVDWTKHEAVLTVEADEVNKEGTVVAVLRTGWMVGDRVLRPAQVSVAG